MNEIPSPNEELDQLKTDFNALLHQLVLNISEIQRLIIDRRDDSSGEDARNLAEVLKAHERYRFKDPKNMSEDQLEQAINDINTALNNAGNIKRSYS